MPAFLFLLTTLFTWIALYQGILAYAVGPPGDDELIAVAGRVDDVATPLTRNRTVEATQVRIEIAPVRFVTVPVRQASLGTPELKQLLGQTVSVRFAGHRPRNRWVYELTSGNHTLVSLDRERGRDAAAHTRSLQLMAVNGLIAAGLLAAAVRARNRRKPDPQHIDRIP